MALEKFQPLLEYNPYHDARGRFTGSGGAKTTVAYSGRRPGGGGVTGAMKRRAEREQAAASHGESLRTMVGKRYMDGGEGKHAMAAALYRQARLHKGADRRSVRDEAELYGKAARAQSGRSSDYVKVPQRPKRYTRRVTSGEHPGNVGIELDRQTRAGGLSPRESQFFRDMDPKVAARSNKAAALASKRYLLGQSKARSAGEDRQQVPQSPGKYTLPTSDGTRRRDGESWKVAAARVTGRSVRLAQGGRGSKKANDGRTDAERSHVRQSRASGNPEAARQAVHDAVRRLGRDLPGGRGTGRNKADERRMKADRRTAPFSPRLMQDEYTPERGMRAGYSSSGNHFLASLAYRSARQRAADSPSASSSWRTSGDDYRAAARKMKRASK